MIGAEHTAKLIFAIPYGIKDESILENYLFRDNARFFSGVDPPEKKSSSCRGVAKRSRVAYLAA
jgi:hypothetical protein